MLLVMIMNPGATGGGKEGGSDEDVPSTAETSALVAPGAATVSCSKPREEQF